MQTTKPIDVPGLWIADDRITIQDGRFSWSEDDPSVLKEFVLKTSVIVVQL